MVSNVRFIFFAVFVVVLCFNTLAYSDHGSTTIRNGDSLDISSQEYKLNSLSVDDLHSLMDSSKFYKDLNPQKSLLYAQLVHEKAGKKGESELEINAALRAGWANRSLAIFDKSIAYFEQALEAGYNINDTISILRAYRGLGSTYYSAGKIRLSIKYFKQILDYKDLYHDREFFASTYKSLGTRYKDLALFEEALQYNLIALKIREGEGNPKKTGSSLIDISVIYWHLRDFDQATTYMDKAMDVLVPLNVDLDRAYNQYGLIYLRKGEYKKALENFIIAYNKNKQQGDFRNMSRNLSNIGIAHKNLGNYKQALQNQQESLKLKKKVNDLRYISNSYTNIGEMYMELEDFSRARLYLDSALLIGKKMENRIRLTGVYLSLAEISERSNRHQEALEYYRLSMALKDSIFAKEKLNNIAELNALYELEKKETENALLKKENQIQALQVSRGKSLLFLVLFFLGFMVLLSGLIYYLFIVKKRNLRILSDKNSLILKQKEELIQVNATKDKFFSIIAHDLRGPFNSILGFLDILNRNYKDYSDKEKKQILEMLGASARNTFGLLENLLTWSRSQRGYINISKGNYELKELIDELILPFKGAAMVKGIAIHNKVETGTNVYADKETISIVLGNLVNNGIKFTKHGGELKIWAKRNQLGTEINVEDNGVGMSEDQVQGLFRIENSMTSKGTDNEEGTGLGLIICKEFVDKNKGEIRVQSKNGKGTLFTIFLPDQGNIRNTEKYLKLA